MEDLKNDPTKESSTITTGKHAEMIRERVITEEETAVQSEAAGETEVTERN